MGNYSMKRVMESKTGQLSPVAKGGGVNRAWLSASSQYCKLARFLNGTRQRILVCHFIIKSFI